MANGEKTSGRGLRMVGTTTRDLFNGLQEPGDQRIAELEMMEAGPSWKVFR